MLGKKIVQRISCTTASRGITCSSIIKNNNKCRISSNRLNLNSNSIVLLDWKEEEPTKMSTTTTVRWYSNTNLMNDNNTRTEEQQQVSITFIQPDGVTEKIVQAYVGESLLRLAHRNDIDLEGACEGGMYVCVCVFVCFFSSVESKL
jgi:hypothetical protein